MHRGRTNMARSQPDQARVSNSSRCDGQSQSPQRLCSHRSTLKLWPHSLGGVTMLVLSGWVALEQSVLSSSKSCEARTTNTGGFAMKPGSFVIRLTALLILSICTTLQAQKIKVIVDQDARGPATTDMQSILIFLQSDKFDVLGITTVSGDQWVKEETAAHAAAAGDRRAYRCSRRCREPSSLF